MCRAAADCLKSVFGTVFCRSKDVEWSGTNKDKLSEIHFGYGQL